MSHQYPAHVEYSGDITTVRILPESFRIQSKIVPSLSTGSSKRISLVYPSLVDHPVSFIDHHILMMGVKGQRLGTLANTPAP